MKPVLSMRIKDSQIVRLLNTDKLTLLRTQIGSEKNDLLIEAIKTGGLQAVIFPPVLEPGTRIL